MTARYLTAGDAHITMTHDTDTRSFTANCGTHGFIASAYYMPAPSDDLPEVRAHVMRMANDHAAKCRQVPEDGAR